MKMLLALALACSALQDEKAPGGLTLEEFRTLHLDLQPARDEVWRSIPWHVSLVEARAQAARERKPLFLWSMNGNPLGCT